MTFVLEADAGDAAPEEHAYMHVDAYLPHERSPVRLRLDDYRGGWLALAFFPPGMTSHAELDRFEALRHAFAAEACDVVAVSVDGLPALGDTRAGFPLVADAQGTLARVFGAIVDGEGYFGTVLLDPDGAVRFDDLGAGPSAERALAALRSLRLSDAA